MKTYRLRGSRLSLSAIVLAGLFHAALIGTIGGKEPAAQSAGPLVMVVMDPLAKPLSCPCVKGYAQRDYDYLGTQLSKELGRPVKVVYNESLVAALKTEGVDHADIIIGKQSVVLFDAKRSDLAVRHVANLTGKDGSTTMTGLVVVPTPDPAQSVADLAGYRLIFGPAECDEKHSAAMQLLKTSGIAVPAKPETAAACDEGACLILELKGDEHGAAVISSYAKPLLEGCGTVEKGALRVIGETEPVPFVAAFTAPSLDAAASARIAQALVSATSAPAARIALETQKGFQAVEQPAAETAKKK